MYKVKFGFYLLPMFSAGELEPTMRISENTLSSNLLVLLTAVNLYILWSLNYLPFIDHPGHLFRIFAYLNLDNPQFNYSELYKVQYFVPYLWSDLITVAFYKLGFDIFTASKLFYTVYIIGLPASVWYFLYKNNHNRSIYTLAATLITFNYSLLSGNESFIIGMPIFLAGFAYWFSKIDDEKLIGYLYKFLVTGAVYFSHPLIIGLFFLVIGFTVSFSELSRKNRIISYAILLFYIAIAILSVFEVSTTTQQKRLYIAHPTLSFKLFSVLASFVPIINNISLVYILGGLIFLLYFFLFVKGVAEDRQKLTSLLFYITVSFILLWLALPHVLLALYMPDTRVGLLGFLLIVGFFPENRRLKLVFIILMVPAIITFQYKLYQDFQQGSSDIEHIMDAFKGLPPNQTFLPINLPPINMRPSIQQAFEYYHLLKGGLGPYHWIGDAFMLNYRKESPRLNTPIITDLRQLNKELLAPYDLVGIIGIENTNIFKAYTHVLSNLGFRKVASNKEGVLILKR